MCVSNRITTNYDGVIVFAYEIRPLYSRKYGLGLFCQVP